MFSVVQAGGRAAAALPEVKKLAVLSTVFTARSGAYPELIGRLAPEKQVISRPCPDLAALVELVVNDPGMRPLIEADLRDDLDDLVNEERVDCCLLGCTHYPLVSDIILDLYPGLFLLDPAVQMAQNPEGVSGPHGHEQPRPRAGAHRCVHHRQRDGVRPEGRPGGAGAPEPRCSITRPCGSDCKEYTWAPLGRAPGKEGSL